MNKLFFLFFALFTSISLYAQPEISFERTYGTPSTQDIGNSLIETADGNLLFVGTTAMGAGGSDIYLVKTDKDGNEIWSKTYGTKEDEVGMGVQELEDGNFMLVGTTQAENIYNNTFFQNITHAYILKIDKDGNEIWSKTTSISSYATIISDVTFDSDGSILLLVFNKSMVKLDVEGNKVWSKDASAANLIDIKSIKGTSQTGFLITGTEYIYESSPQGGTRNRTAQTIKVDSEGNLQWSAIIEGVNSWVGQDAIYTKSGEVIMLSNAYEGDNSIIIQKVDDLGQVIWTKEHSLSGINIEGNQLLESENGEIYVVGEGFISTSKRKDAFILKLNSEGEKIEFSNYNFGIEDMGKNLIESDNGELLLVGNTRSFNGTGEDVLAMRITTNGEVIWNKSFGEVGNMDNDIGTELLELADGGYLIGGHSTSVSEYGDSDISLIRVDEIGEIQWQKSIDFFHGQDYCHRIVKVGEEGYAIWGESEDEMGITKLQLTRIDKEGTILWAKRFELLRHQWDRYGVSSLLDGGFAVCGTLSNTTESSYYAKLDEEGTVIWEHDYKAWGLNRIKPTSDGGFILSGRGEYLTQNGGTYDGYKYVPMEILKVNTQGEPIWKFYWGQPSNSYVMTLFSDVIELSSGNFAWIGTEYHEDTPSVSLGMLDNEGNELWTEYLLVSPKNIGFSLKEANDGSILIMGAETKYSGEGGAILAKMNCQGELEWSQVFTNETQEDYRFVGGLQTQDGGLTILGTKTIDKSSEIVFLKTVVESPASNPCITSIEETSTLLSPLQLKPNQSRDFVQLSFTNEFTGEIEINVFDITGRLVVSFLENKNEMDYQKQLDIKKWSEGLYIVEVLSGNQRYTHKLIKQ